MSKYSIPHQSLDPTQQAWIVTFGTYAARLHGGVRATVDRQHNQPGQAFISRNDARQQFERNRLRGAAVSLTREHCEFIEATIPAICKRGGWILRTCSAAPPPADGDHVHVVLDAPRSADGKSIRELLKRWLSQALNAQWPRPESGSWWAEGGSNKPIDDESYLNNAVGYVDAQRTMGSIFGEPARPRAD